MYFWSESPNEELNYDQTIQELDSGTTYQIRVVAKNGEGLEAPAQWQEFRTSGVGECAGATPGSVFGLWGRGWRRLRNGRSSAPAVSVSAQAQRRVPVKVLGVSHWCSQAFSIAVRDLSARGQRPHTGKKANCCIVLDHCETSVKPLGTSASPRCLDGLTCTSPGCQIFLGRPGSAVFVRVLVAPAQKTHPIFSTFSFQFGTQSVQNTLIQDSPQLGKSFWGAKRCVLSVGNFGMKAQCQVLVNVLGVSRGDQVERIGPLSWF